MSLFGQAVLPSHVLPYLREYVQNSFVRMGLPPLTLNSNEKEIRTYKERWPTPLPSEDLARVRRLWNHGIQQSDTCCNSINSLSGMDSCWSFTWQNQSREHRVVSFGGTPVRQ